MFYLIQFDNVESEETKQLQFELRGYPNGSILSYAINIKDQPNLLGNHLIEHEN